MKAKIYEPNGSQNAPAAQGGFMRTLKLTSLAGIFLGIAMMSILMIAAPPPAFAQFSEIYDKYYSGSGDWSVDDNWNNSGMGWGQPTFSDDAYIMNDNMVTITADYEEAANLHVGHQDDVSYNDHTGAIEMSSGSLNISGNLEIGDYNSGASTGSFTQSGGAVAIGTGTGSGYLTITNGSVYNYSGGTLSVPEAIGNGTGTFKITGDATDNITAPNGINVDSLEVSDSGTFSQNGMTINTSGDLTLGASSDGTYNYESGTLAIGGDITTGSGTGTLNIEGDATSSVTVSGNDISVTNFNVGNGSGKSGTFILTSGKTLTAADEIIGKSGTGRFTQSGGENTVTSASTLTIAEEAGSSGTYQLTGGTLSTNAISFGSGTGTFEMDGSGAILRVTDSITSVNPGTVNLISGTFLGSPDITNTNVTIGSNVTVDPGFPVATQTISGGNQTWKGGGIFVFNIHNATGAPGVGWNFMNFINGAGFDFLLGGGFGNFNIDIQGFAAEGVPGDPLNFDPNQNFNWAFVNATGITGFDPDLFNLSVSGFTGVTADKFSISADSSGLKINYEGEGPAPVVPEPATVVSIIGGFAVAGLRRLFKRRS